MGSFPPSANPLDASTGAAEMTTRRVLAELLALIVGIAAVVVAVSLIEALS